MENGCNGYEAKTKTIFLEEQDPGFFYLKQHT